MSGWYELGATKDLPKGNEAALDKTLRQLSKADQYEWQLSSRRSLFGTSYQLWYDVTLRGLKGVPAAKEKLNEILPGVEPRVWVKHGKVYGEVINIE